jgi:hypothetical protein
MNVHRFARSAEMPRFIRPALRGASGALLIAALCTGCGKSGSAVIGKDPVTNVIKVENNVDALRAWAANGARASVLVHIDPSDDMTIFPANMMKEMENTAGHLRRRDVKVLEETGSLIERGGTVSLGYMTGMYKRVIWVIPTLNVVGRDPVDVYKNFLIKQRKFPPAAVSDLKTDGAFITGTIAGIPLTITRLDDLTLGADEDAIVDIDLSYFPAMRLADRSYRPGTKSLLGFLRQLGARNVKAKLVTVNLSNQNNQVPMDLRFFGDVIREGLAKPAELVPPLPAKWQGMIQGEDSLGAKRYASAAAIYEDLIRTNKDDAGLYFSLAVARGFENKGIEARAAMLEAYRLDSEYLMGFFQLARVLGDAGVVDAGFDLLETPEIAKIVAPVELDYQRGLFLYTAHKPFDAAAYLGRVAQQRPKDFGLFTILFRAQREAGNEQGQMFALNKLVSIDDGRVRREMPWVYADLGRLYERQGFLGNASEMYDRYIQVHPGDSLSKVFTKRIDGWKAKKLIKP